MEFEFLARSEQELIPQLSARRAPQSSDKTTALAFGLGLSLDPQTVVSTPSTQFRD